MGHPRYSHPSSLVPRRHRRPPFTACVGRKFTQGGDDSLLLVECPANDELLLTCVVAGALWHVVLDWDAMRKHIEESMDISPELFANEFAKALTGKLVAEVEGDCLKLTLYYGDGRRRSDSRAGHGTHLGHAPGTRQCSTALSGGALS